MSIRSVSRLLRTSNMPAPLHKAAHRGIKLSVEIKEKIKNDPIQPHEMSLEHASSLWRWLVKESDAHNVRPESRLVIATTILFTLNSPTGLAGTYKAATEGLDLSKPGDLQQATQVAQVMREAGLKCAALNGLPGTINCLAGLRGAFDQEVTDSLPTQAKRGLSMSHAPHEQVAQRGAELFDNIYHPQTEKLIGVLGQNHPDMPAFVVQFEYGGLLSPPAPDYPVGREDTSILAVACLRSQGGVAPQVMSHILGLRKAETVHGASWLTSEEGCRWLLSIVDGFANRARQAESVKAKL